jgi:histidinol-phosphate aminotransferase
LYRQIIAVLGGEVISVPLTPELQFDTEAIRSRLRLGRAGLLILCSPNNPTGCVLSDEDLRSLAREFEGIVVIDEAYHEFSRHTAAPLLRDLPNLIVLRTFSKAMAMAGLRVGYLMSSSEITREIHKALLPYNLNFFSGTAAEVACERYDLLEPQIELIIKERERLTRGIDAIRGLTAFPSAANFILVRTALSPQKLFRELLDRDILVRDVSKYSMLSDCLRLSVGAPDENDRLLEALREAMAGNR